MAEPILEFPGLRVSDAPPVRRFVLRSREAGIEPAGAVLGMALPRTACRAAVGANGTAALWQGPDEWLLLVPPDRAIDLASRLSEALAAIPHATVEVTNRNLGFILEGDRVVSILNAGCPLDLDRGAFAVATCTRTLFGKSEICLWRTGEESFRIEIWRSFADYLLAYLAEAAHELVAP